MSELIVKTRRKLSDWTTKFVDFIEKNNRSTYIFIAPYVILFTTFIVMP